MHSVIKLCHYLLFAAISIFPVTVLAKKLPPSQKITSGEYLSEGGRGVMNIRDAKNGVMAFDIQSGSERGVCDLQGNINKNKATLATELGGTSCSIEFMLKPNGIEVKSSQTEACRSFCGVHVSFDGLYMKPALGCSSIELAKADENFKRLHDEKSYAEALAVIEPALNNCAKTSVWIENVERRNNLAMTLYKLKKFDECLSVLEPLREDSKKSKEVITEEHMRIEGAAYIDMLKTTRIHLKLCEAKK
jgi:hypothetical protein